MPAVSFDSLSFLLDGARTRARRLLVAAASFDAALVEPSTWPSELARLRHAGFNTIVIRVPWILHEPTPGRFDFEGALDLRRAVELAGREGLRVMLRIGPCVGGSFRGGGLPVWLRDAVGSSMRVADPAFLARVTAFWRTAAPHFVDLQASRNGSTATRPVIAVGIEDDWRCLDAEVGDAYFGALVRFARELGVDVPLFTSNNGWYTHEGTIDAWRGASDIGRTADELRQVHADAPPLLMHDAVRTELKPDARAAAWARLVAGSVAARADFSCEVTAIRHRAATSVRGGAEIPGVDLFRMRRALVFASTFGETLAGMAPQAPSVDARGCVRTILLGESGGSVEVVVDEAAVGGGPGSVRKTKAAARPDASASPSGIDFYATDLRVGSAVLERCSGSLVALLGDIVVVAGAPRARIEIKADGSDARLTVPAEGAAPKIARVRGLRIALVTQSLAAGVGIVADAVEFVDPSGVVLARVRRDGKVERAGGKTAKERPSAACAARPVALSAPHFMAEVRLVDGTHPRFARIAAPRSLGAYGLASMHAYYAARFTPPSRRASSILAMPSGGMHAERRLDVPGARRRSAWIAEIRGDGHPHAGGRVDERDGVLGPLLEVTPLRRVRAQLVDMPDFDATRIGRFAWGYDARAAVAGRQTVRWTFAARDRPVVVRLPAFWWSEGHAAIGHALRLNGSLLDHDMRVGAELLLDGAGLSPMKPAPVPKGEKRPKGRNIKMVAAENELLLDLHGDAAIDARLLRRLAKETELLDCLGAIAAEWSFARVDPPASWSLSLPLPKRPVRGGAAPVDGTPAWFRWIFRLNEAARPGESLELVVDHPAGRVATLLVNGVPAMSLDGASGERLGTARQPMLRRTVAIASSHLRRGENEIVAFEPDGRAPAVTASVVPA